VRRIHHLDSQLVRLGQREEAARDQDQVAQQVRIDPVTGEMEETNITRGVAQLGQKFRARRGAGVEPAEIEQGNGSAGAGRPRVGLPPYMKNCSEVILPSWLTS
jgi:hypothetical protein